MKWLFVKRVDLSDKQTPAIFKYRRRIILMPMILVLSTIILDLAVDALHKFPQSYIYLRFIILLAVGVFVFLIYRCPRCGDPPKSSQVGTSGVLLFPRKCSKCGAPLMPDHKWAQD